MTGYRLTRQWVLHSPDGTHALCGDRKAAALTILHAIQPPPAARPVGRPKGPPRPEQPPRARGRPLLPESGRRPVGRPRRPTPTRDSEGLFTWRAEAPDGGIADHRTERADITACVFTPWGSGGWYPLFWGTRAAATGVMRSLSGGGVIANII